MCKVRLCGRGVVDVGGGGGGFLFCLVWFGFCLVSSQVLGLCRPYSSLLFVVSVARAASFFQRLKVSLSISDGSKLTPFCAASCYLVDRVSARNETFTGEFRLKLSRFAPLVNCLPRRCSFCR